MGAFFHGGPRDCYDNLHVRLAGLPDAALIFSGGAAAAAATAATFQRCHVCTHFARRVDHNPHEAMTMKHITTLMISDERTA
jgi:hypothetical protein